MIYKKIIIILFSGIILNVAGEDAENELRVADRIIKPLKNAIVEVQAVNGIYSIITIVRNDGAEVRMELHLDAENVNASTFTKIKDVNPPWIWITHDDVIYTTISIDPGATRISVIRKMPQANVPIPAEHVTGSFSDCFVLKDNVHWMGGPQLKYQRWPIQDMYLEERAYTPNHRDNMAIAERYWLSSEGFTIWINAYVQLFVDQNNRQQNRLCFITENKYPYKDTSLQAAYQLGWSSDARAAQEFVGSHYWIPSKRLPDERIILYPIWSTFQRYGRNVNETVVTNFANEIKVYNFSNSQLEIDDNWEMCYGSTVMDPAKFPNVTRLTSALKGKGFRVTLWVHPFVNIDCEPNYSVAVNSGYFVRNLDDDTRTTWWNGPNGAGVLDFTYYNSTMSFVERLRALQSLGIDGFNFDAAEASWVPQLAKFHSSIPSYRPSYFTKSYANAVSLYLGNMSIVSAGWDTQNLPIFTRMANKDSKFTWNNGLPTLITTLLEMNLAGYVFIIPDVMGGSGDVFSTEVSTRPSKNLYIRWVQATTFMPVMHFSIPPWDYDDETITICQKYVALHEEMAPRILRFMNVSITDRIPLNRPIWWVDPENPEAYKVNDEYLLGDEILVAPVTAENAQYRDIYFPNGAWYDPTTNHTYVGPRLLRNYPSGISILPYFIRRT